MIYIGIHRQRLSKNWANICRFVLSPWGNYCELTVFNFLNKSPYLSIYRELVESINAIVLRIKFPILIIPHIKFLSKLKL